LADKFGLSWQVIPKQMEEMMSDSDAAKAKRASDAMFTMKKIDIAEMKKAFDG
jgi:predicted 3-demethylubiquinone-9 3-methyltransferase (glyoxalase superfamily)